MSKYFSLYIGLVFAFLAITSPVYAVDPLYFYDWYHGRDGQAIPAGYPLWLEDKPEDKESVAKAIKWELYTGYPDRTLKLTDSITRAEFAVALARVLDAGEDGGGAWYAKRVNALVANGIINSASGNWSVLITRGEMGQWMGRAAQKYGIGIKYKNISFADTDDAEILAAAKTGVISGYSDGFFKPDEKAQRVHAALMLVRLAGTLNNSPLSEVVDLSKISKKAFQQEQEVRKDWVLGDNKELSFSSVLAYESELNLKWLALVEEEYQKLNPDYGWAKDVITYSAKPVELHRTTAVIKVSGKVQNYDKDGNKLYDVIRYEGFQYFIMRGGKWVLTHGESV